MCIRGGLPWSPPAPGAHTLDLHLGFPSGSVMVPPYSTGTWSGLIYFSKTSFQFAGRRGKEGERRVTTRYDFITALAIYTKEAGKNTQSTPAHETQVLGAHDVGRILPGFRRGHPPTRVLHQESGDLGSCPHCRWPGCGGPETT